MVSATSRPKSRKTSPQAERSTPARGLDRYALLSQRPLHVLVFLLPLIVLFELGSALYLTNPHAGDIETIRAQRLLYDFFERFGVSSLYLPGVLIVVVLLVWHFLLRDTWRIRWSVIGWMAVEAVAWTLPLLVLGQILFRLLWVDAGGGPEAAAAAGGGTAAWQQMGWTARATIAIGAGLYEELLFRMVAIAVFHAICADLLKMRELAGKGISVLLAALAFAVYHDISAPGGGIEVSRFVFYVFAGLYFGMVYVLRGFGIVVATHALYDLAVLVLLPGMSGGPPASIG